MDCVCCPPKATRPPPPKSTISLPVDTIMKEKKEEKWGKMKIGVGSFATAKVGDMDNTREGDIKRMIKKLVGCVLVSQYFPNIFVGMVFPCLPTEVDITCNFLMTPYICCSIFFARTELFHSTKVGVLSLLEGNKHQSI